MKLSWLEQPWLKGKKLRLGSWFQLYHGFNGFCSKVKKITRLFALQQRKIASCSLYASGGARMQGIVSLMQNGKNFCSCSTPFERKIILFDEALTRSDNWCGNLVAKNWYYHGEVKPWSGLPVDAWSNQLCVVPDDFQKARISARTWIYLIVEEAKSSNSWTVWPFMSSMVCLDCKGAWLRKVFALDFAQRIFDDFISHGDQKLPW